MTRYFDTFRRGRRAYDPAFDFWPVHASASSIEITSFGLSEDLDRVKRLADSGVARVVASISPAKADTVLPMVDRWTNIMRQVNR
jgi:hypothetical protein